ncbi:MAG: 30S ribosomal protein S16 [Chloroflexota bacterium]
MLRIRLSRTGKKKQASYRVVVADADAKRDGRIVERIGHYNPLPDPIDYRIQEDRALYWLSVGAQPSDAVRRLLEKQGTYDRLARLRAGESAEALIAEYEGRPLAAPVQAEETAVAVAEPAPVVDVVEETTSDEEE